jgi:hypothetical protein
MYSLLLLDGLWAHSTPDREIFCAILIHKKAKSKAIEAES